jgi:CheY-like chemotaxis protein
LPVKILIIEDGLIGSDFFRRILEAKEYNVVEANTIAKGITLAEENRPDLILIDIFALLDVIAPNNNDPFKNNPVIANIPVIAILPRSPRHSQRIPLETRFNGYFLKLMTEDDLLNYLKEFPNSTFYQNEGIKEGTTGLLN